MRVLWAVLGIGVLLAGGAAACSGPRGGAGAEAALLGWINARRAANGLAAYRLSDELAQAARVQACDMATHRYFGHSRPGAPGLSQRIKATGYRLRAEAENLAHTTGLDTAVVGRMWQRSAPHWAAIVDPGHRDIGLAIATGGGRHYWVMVVAR